MLEINYWFFVQLANFILLLLILNKMLYKPMLRLFKERDDSTRGALENAKALDGEKDAVMEGIEAKLAEARTEARTIFEQLSSEGLGLQRSAVESAQNEAVDINRKAKAELETAVQQARASLKSDIDTFAKQIVERLVEA